MYLNFDCHSLVLPLPQKNPILRLYNCCIFFLQLQLSLFIPLYRQEVKRFHFPVKLISNFRLKNKFRMCRSKIFYIIIIYVCMIHYINIFLNFKIRCSIIVMNVPYQAFYMPACINYLQEKVFLSQKSLYYVILIDYNLNKPNFVLSKLNKAMSI